MKPCRLFPLLIVMLLLTACQRDVSRMAGDYSYKLSGEIEIVAADGTVTHTVVRKIGQMNILRQQDNDVLVTLNELSGDVVVMQGQVRGDSLILEPAEFTTTIAALNDDDHSIIEEILNAGEIAGIYKVNASGRGALVDNILILKMHWIGRQLDTPQTTIEGTDLTLVAERN